MRYLLGLVGVLGMLMGDIVLGQTPQVGEEPSRTGVRTTEGGLLPKPFIDAMKEADQTFAGLKAKSPRFGVKLTEAFEAGTKRFAAVVEAYRKDPSPQKINEVVKSLVDTYRTVAKGIAEFIPQGEEFQGKIHDLCRSLRRAEAWLAEKSAVNAQQLPIVESQQSELNSKITQLAKTYVEGAKKDRELRFEIAKLRHQMAYLDLDRRMIETQQRVFSHLIDRVRKAIGITDEKAAAVTYVLDSMRMAGEWYAKQAENFSILGQVTSIVGQTLGPGPMASLPEDIGNLLKSQKEMNDMLPQVEAILLGPNQWDQDIEEQRAKLKTATTEDDLDSFIEKKAAEAAEASVAQSEPTK